MKSESPIGIFDSGIGGTSIWQEIRALLPLEHTIYLSDSKNAPYGQKTKEEIVNLSIKNTEFLLENNCKIIVVACNTATTNAIKVLREKYDVPFIGIEPAIKPASLKTKNNVIGILATKGTLNSELFEKTSSSLESDITIIEQVGEGLVDLIENDELNSLKMDYLLNKYLTPMKQANTDCIVLGCTHYPYLKQKIQDIVGTDITIIDSGYAVALQTKRVLENLKLSNKKEEVKKMLEVKYTFYINKNKNTLGKILKNYATEIEIIEHNF
ncbi:glutamate racemase [Tenacibaculum sp. 190524A02b]|uniref:Glutamate racemase n=1 Tax=Tenacibaculum vairaonense TaxID=3137860 RepID=A0ABP1FK62_9FLAO